MPMKSADETAVLMIDGLLKDLSIQPGEKIMLMLNGTGATTLMELLIVYRKCAAYLKEKGVEIVASHNQEGNTPENSMDGDFVSRWAAEGSAWIKYTFIEPREISSVWIAYYSASETRKAKLEIQVSEDGENFVSVFKGMSTASKVELEEFKLPQPMTVKAVKVLGDGNTVNNWNVIAEIDFR